MARLLLIVTVRDFPTQSTCYAVLNGQSGLVTGMAGIAFMVAALAYRAKKAEF